MSKNYKIGDMIEFDNRFSLRFNRVKLEGEIVNINQTRDEFLVKTIFGTTWIEIKDIVN